MNKNKKDTKIKIKLLFLGLISAVLIIIIICNHYSDNLRKIYNRNCVYTLNPIKEEMTYDASSKISFDMYDQNIIKCSKDGIKMINIEGKTIWDKPYAMKYPNLTIKYPYIASGDLRGNVVYVFNKDGLVYKIATKYPILFYIINRKGMLVVVEQNEDEHFITLFNNKGEKIIFRSTTVEHDGYPLAVALSDNGQKMVTSYLETSDLKLISKVTFFDLGYDGEYYVDKIAGSNHFENTIIPEINFLYDDYFIAIGDTKIFGFKFELAPKKIWESKNNNKIKYSDGGNNYFTIAYGEPLLGNNQDLNHQVIMYDSYGRQIGKYSLNKTITYLKVHDDLVIIGNNRNFRAVDKKGKVKWYYDAKKDIKKVIPFSKGKKVLMIGKNSVDILQMSKIE